MSKEAMKMALDYVETEITALAYLKEEMPQGLLDLQYTLKEALANHILDATKMVSVVKDSLTTQQEQGEPYEFNLEKSLSADCCPYCETLIKKTPLTFEQIRDLWLENHNNGGATDVFARLIELAHGIGK